MHLGTNNVLTISYRTRRARVAGSRICALAAILSIVCGLNALYWKLPAIAAGDLLLLLGCLASLRPEREKFVWWPAYLAFWLSSFLTLFASGCAASPFFTEYMLLLFIVALIVQSRFDWKQALAFTLGNVAFWTAVQLASGERHLAPLPTGYTLSSDLILFGAIIACVRSLVATEEKLANKADAHSRALAETRMRLSHSARLAEVGNLVAATTHEIAQPIQVISSSSALLARLFENGQEDDRRVAALVANIEESSKRIGLLLRDLKNLSRPGTCEISPLDVRDAVRSVQTFTQFDLRSRRIAYSIELPERPLRIDGDSVRLQQVLLNLVNNARDACEAEASPEIRIRALRAGPWARISIENNGPEIPLEVQDKIFDAYFTTKDRERGTGLGLSICAQIAERLGGRILFASEPGRTCFMIDLPLRAEALPIEYAV